MPQSTETLNSLAILKRFVALLCSYEIFDKPIVVRTSFSWKLQHRGLPPHRRYSQRGPVRRRACPATDHAPPHPIVRRRRPLPYPEATQQRQNLGETLTSADNEG